MRCVEIYVPYAYPVPDYRTSIYGFIAETPRVRDHAAGSAVARHALGAGLGAAHGPTNLPSMDLDTARATGIPIGVRRASHVTRSRCRVCCAWSVV